MHCIHIPRILHHMGILCTAHASCAPHMHPVHRTCILCTAHTQGLDLTNPSSEARIQSARMRPLGPSLGGSSRPSSAGGNLGGGSLAGGGGATWRPGTAPAHLMRPQSARSRLASPGARGRGGGSVAGAAR